MSNNKPVFFSQLEELPDGVQKIDTQPISLFELFFIENPGLKKNQPGVKEKAEQFVKTHTDPGVWVYYPWLNKAVRIASEDIYFRLRTARNRNIITTEEQANYRNVTVGIAGLSVGSAILNALVVSGGPKRIKIADPDTVELTNLNRINARVQDIGTNKTVVAARNTWELDPFAELTLLESGLTEQSLEQFILGEPRLDIFIDEMDDLKLKIYARELCRKNHIPVIMATDNGDGVILDVERFDLEPEREVFHGLIGNYKLSDFDNLDYPRWLELATKIVGPKYLTERMKASLPEIGKTLPAVPQLGTSANVAGSVISLVVRWIANKKSWPSGRYLLVYEAGLPLVT